MKYPIIEHKKWNDFVERIFLGEEKIYSFYTDFLRSKGYAIPFLGMSVEEMKKLGWIKIN